MHRSSTVSKSSQNKSKQSKKNYSLVDFGERTTGIDLFSGGIVIMDYGLVFWPGVTSKMKLKCFNDGFIYKHAVWLHTMLIGGLDWRGVDYLWIIVVYLSSVWTLILTAPIHCRGFIGEPVMQNICSDEETNSSTSWKTE